MSWMLLSLRRSELTRSLSEHTYQKLQLSAEKRRLTSFANAIGDGHITPTEITSMGSKLYGDALDFMGYSAEVAEQVASEQTDYYATAYDSLTQQQYYNNPSIAAQANLYYDENGSLDTERMYQKFYEEALKEFAQNYIMPILKEKEVELENQQNELETLVEQEQAELQEIKQAISSDIQNSTIKLS